MTQKRQSRGGALLSLAGAILIAVIANRGVVAIIPDFILRDVYGDIHGIFGLPLVIGTVIVFTVSWRWLTRLQGYDE